MWLVLPLRAPLSLLAALLATACAGAASMVLRPPIADKCRDTGLHGCDELADGIVDYAMGDKQAAAEQIKKAAAKNAPDELQEFAAKLRLLKSVPGADQYAGPLVEVADLLSASGPPARATAATGSARVEAGGRRREDDAIVISVIPSVQGAACSPFTDEGFSEEPGQWRCQELSGGPLVVSDVETTGSCPNALVLAVGSLGAPRWWLYVDPGIHLSVHGAGYAVRAGERMVALQAAIRGVPEARDMRCTLTVAAHPVAPY